MVGLPRSKIGIWSYGKSGPIFEDIFDKLDLFFKVFTFLVEAHGHGSLEISEFPFSQILTATLILQINSKKWLLFEY